MTGEERRNTVEFWKRSSLVALSSARLLFDTDEYSGCTNRAYYAAYQAGTSVCIAHGDEGNFPPRWNNPSHEQLPDFIRNNGDIPTETRQRVRSILRALRTLREIADYRPGHTLLRSDAVMALRYAAIVLEALEIRDNQL
jgi:hypothetical protein